MLCLPLIMYGSFHFPFPFNLYWNGFLRFCCLAEWNLSRSMLSSLLDVCCWLCCLATFSDTFKRLKRWAAVVRNSRILYATWMFFCYASQVIFSCDEYLRNCEWIVDLLISLTVTYSEQVSKHFQQCYYTYCLKKFWRESKSLMADGQLVIFLFVSTSTPFPWDLSMGFDASNRMILKLAAAIQKTNSIAIVLLFPNPSCQKFWHI